MGSTEPASDWRGLLSLRRTRALVRGRRGLALAAGIGAGYVLVSLVAGAMLEFLPTGQSTTTVNFVWYDVPQWWNYPALLVVAPGGVLVLPFLATLSMAIVAVGVGLGMGAGLRLAIRILRDRRRVPAGAGAAGSLAGLTPAMLALLTLGACCSTSAAAAAGIGAIAQSAGSTYSALEFNSWYLNVFQIGILAVALVAQEQLLAVYGALAGIETPAVRPEAETARVPRVRRLPVTALRILLVSAGTLWSLAWLLELASPGPTGASVWVGGFLQHPFLGMAMVGLGLSPALLLGLTRPRDWYGTVPLFRALLFVTGFSVAIGVPPPLTGWGVGGLGNEILGLRGVGPAAGGGSVTPGVPPALLLAWGVAYAVLGFVAMALAARPSAVLRALALDDDPRPTTPGNASAGIAAAGAAPSAPEPSSLAEVS